MPVDDDDRPPDRVQDLLSTMEEMLMNAFSSTNVISRDEPSPSVELPADSSEQTAISDQDDSSSSVELRDMLQAAST